MLSVITTIQGLEEIKDQWSDLWRRSSEATPFQSPEWILAWLHHLYKGGELRVVSIREGQKLTALFPFFLWGERLQHLTLLGTGVTDYNDALVDRVTDVAESMREAGAWETATFEELQSRSQLRTLRESGREEVCSVCPVIALPGRMAELVARLEAKFRTDLRKAQNKLARMNVSIARSTDVEDLFRLHRARWEERRQEGVLADQDLENFHREVAAAFEALGILRLYRLCLDGDCAAVLYAFQHRERCYGYLSGFDPRFRKLSPSNVLLAHGIEEAIGEGAREFDFLRGGEPYKYSWTARDVPLYRVVVGRNG